MDIYGKDDAKRFVGNPFGYAIWGDTDLRHQAALQILARFDEVCEPFALYLARWDIGTLFGDEAAWMAYGDELQAPEPLHDKWARYLSHLPIPMLMVTDPEQRMDRAWCPSIRLDQDDWELEVRKYVEFADLVIVQPGFFPGSGLEAELELIRRAGKQHCTVVLLPVLEGELHANLEKNRDPELLAGFNRLADTNELSPLHIMDSPCIADIAARMLATKKLSAGSRRDWRAEFRKAHGRKGARWERCGS